jgi:hypothetical protein
VRCFSSLISFCLAQQLGRLTEEMFASNFEVAEQIWETLAEGYGLQWRSMLRDHTMSAYLFRYALGIVIYLFWWIGVAARSWSASTGYGTTSLT